MGEPAARAIRLGHPWIYRDALRALRPGDSPQDGQVIEVRDEEGRFLGRGLFDSVGAIAVRMFSTRPDENLGLPLLRDRLRNALALRQRFIPADTTAWRVFNSEGDGLPGATCDRFGDYLLVHLYTASWERHEATLLDALEEIAQPAGIYLQRRYVSVNAGQPRAPAEHARGRTAPVELEVLEGGVRFLVDMTAPLSPGLFPDLREGRFCVARHSAGRRLLNLFSFTGAFAVHALKSGASSVTSIDLAPRAHARARQNVLRNQLSEAACEFLAEDVRAALARLQARGRMFDLIVLDPPTFSLGGSGPMVLARQFGELVGAALGVLATEGLLAVSANTHRLSRADLDRACAEGAASAGSSLRVLQRYGLPPDFPVLASMPDAHYLKFALMTRL